MSKSEHIHVGKISGVFGVKGWLKIISYTSPRDNIIRYKNWLLRKGAEQKSANVIAGHSHGKGVVAHIEGVGSRDDAFLWVGWDIYINHQQLIPAENGEYYWADLVGLDVENLDGVDLGKVDGLMETGANDILLVKGDRDRAIPFLQGRTVKSIDLESNRMIVDWDADF